MIVEAPAEVIRASGVEAASPQQIFAFCRDLFPDAARRRGAERGRNRRGANSSPCETAAGMLPTWSFSAAPPIRRIFPSASICARWLEDAESLAECLCSGSSLADALRTFESARRPKAESLQRAAQASLTWFENVRRYIDKPFAQFVFSLLTNTMRINYPRIAKAAPALARAVDDLAAGRRWPAARPQPRQSPIGAADAHALSLARAGAAQSHRGVADVHVFGDRRHRERFPSGASGQPGGRRRRPGADRDDRRAAGGTHQPALRRHVFPRACSGLGAGGEVRAHPQQFQDRHPARPCGPQRRLVALLGRTSGARRRPSGRSSRPSPLRVRDRPPGAPGDDPRRHGQGPRRLRAGDARCRTPPAST